jgi:hypothetical protein
MQITLHEKAKPLKQSSISLTISAALTDATDAAHRLAEPPAPDTNWCTFAHQNKIDNANPNR